MNVLDRYWESIYKCSQRTGRGNSEAVRRKRTIARQRSRSNGMGESSQPAQRDCRRDYSQGINLYLNEGDEVVDCDLIMICEHEIAVGRMKELG